MSHDQHAPDPSPALPFCALWPDLSSPWGDVSADQADGFAPVEERETPSPDVSDDKGYGFGV